MLAAVPRGPVRGPSGLLRDRPWVMPGVIDPGVLRKAAPEVDQDRLPRSAREGVVVEPPSRMALDERCGRSRQVL